MGRYQKLHEHMVGKTIGSVDGQRWTPARRGLVEWNADFTGHNAAPCSCTARQIAMAFDAIVMRGELANQNSIAATMLS